MLELFQNLFAPPRHMILLLLAAWLGLAIAEKRGNRHSIEKDDINNIVFYALIAFVVGGRLFHVLQNISAFVKSPLGIISINPDLFDPFGGLVIAAVAAFIYGQRKRLEFWNTLDALTPFFAVIMIGLGLSHLAAGTAFGKATDLPWGIDLWNTTRHPTQIYETLASILTLGLLWFLNPNPRPGILFLTFTALTAFSQLAIQAFRGDSTLLANGIRQEQVIAWAMLAVCFLLVEARLARKKSKR